MWSAYVRSLNTRPLLTKSCTSFTGFIIGDSIAQYSTEPKFDKWRTARFATYGFVMHGPLCHFLYELLDKASLLQSPGGHMEELPEFGLCLLPENMLLLALAEAFSWKVLVQLHSLPPDLPWLCSGAGARSFHQVLKGSSLQQHQYCHQYKALATESFLHLG